MTSPASVRPKQRTYECARCHKTLRHGNWIFSYERQRYCTDVDACSRRAARLARQLRNSTAPGRVSLDGNATRSKGGEG